MKIQNYIHKQDDGGRHLTLVWHIIVLHHQAVDNNGGLSFVQY